MTKQRNGGAGDRSKVDWASARTVAELARAGFAIVSQPLMQICYEVHHVQDRPGYLRDALLEEGGKSRFTETLTTAAHGLGLVVGIRPMDLAPGINGHQLDRGQPAIVYRDDPRGATRRFLGTVSPNVSFVYESARAFEAIVSIEVEPKQPLVRHARAIRAVMTEVARIADAEAQAPLVLMQSPAQLPVKELRPESEPDRPMHWPRSSSLAVRFSIAHPHPTADLRLRIADALDSFCRSNGFGLWLADLRPGYRAGNWFAVCEHDTELARRSFDTGPDPRGASQAYVGLPVTFVGPARTDAMRGILDYLSLYREVGVLACSMATINDISFIHLILTTNSVTKSALKSLNASLDVDPPESRYAADRLAHVLRTLVGKDHNLSRSKQWQEFRHRVGDYDMLVGQALPTQVDSGDGRGALWVSWEVEGRQADMSVPFLALHDALAHLGLLTSGQSGANIEYLICRKVRNSVLRGKGKLSLPTPVMPDGDVPRALSALSETIESVWRAKLDARHRVRELTVSWREYWLGHWTGPVD